jgi:superfamily II DNA or RNA helicase
VTHTEGVLLALDRYGLKQSELTKIMPSAPPALIRDNAGAQPVSSEAAKNLAEREGDQRTDLRGAAGGYVLEGAKTASPRWAREIRGLLTGLEHMAPEAAASNLSRAQAIAAKMRGVSPRQIMDLGHGLDANAVLMAGASPGNKAGPLYAAKFIEPQANPTTHLQERALVSKILGPYGVPTHGAYAHGRGGVEIQDYAPFVATPEQRAAVEQQTKDRGKFWLNRHLWDINDHAGNVRLLPDGTPAAIDARFDSGPGFARTVRGTIEERYRDQRQTGAAALHAAQEGRAQEVPPPKWHQEAAGHAADAAWEHAPYLAGGVVAGLYGYGLKKTLDRNKEEQTEDVSKTADHLDTLALAGTVALGAGTLFLGGVAVNDLWKGRKFDEHHEKFTKFLGDKTRLVDTKAHIAMRDPQSVAITTRDELKKKVDDEFKGHSKLMRRLTVESLAPMLKQDGGNAAMLPGLAKQYVIARAKELPEILDHELGHALDYRKKGLTHKNQGPYESTFIGSIWKPRYQKETMRAETEAWKHAPDSPHKKKIQDAALGTYDTGFHQERGEFAGSLATLMASATAYLALNRMGAKLGFAKLAASSVARQVKDSIVAMLKSHKMPESSPYVVLAGSAMYFHGLRPAIRDIDVYVPNLPVAHEERVYGAYEVDAKPTWDLWSASELMRDSVVIDGVRVMSLKAILRMKKAMNRPKDQADIATLEKKLTKTADVDTKLQPHQQRVVDRLLRADQPGLVAMHGLGSGKTLTSIAAADALGMPADVVLPAALRANYIKELQKHAPNSPPPTNIQSLENVARKQLPLTNPLLIVDEAHRSRNVSKTQRALQNNEAKKRLLLTGSLFYNQPSDAAGPVNLVAGGSVLPGDPDEFRRLFVREQEYTPGFFGKMIGRKPSVTYDVNPKTKKYLEGVLSKYVDYHPSSATDFPSRTDETIGVPMAERQKEIYDMLIGRAPKWVHDRVVSGLPPSKAEAARLNSFLQGTRQVSNSTAPYHTDRPSEQPKIDRAVKELNKLFKENPQAKALVYSSYLDAGINPYKKKLDKLQIPYGEFTGALSPVQRDQMVRDYNDNKIKALLLSRAGGEGLDLKGTRLIQLLEPHWNEEALKQVTGRGIRYQSHNHLPEDQRNVHVQHFVTENPRQGFAQKLRLKKPDMSVDQYLFNMSKQKEELNQRFRDLLKEQK